MKINIRAFQRDFPRLRRLTAVGTGVLGCITGGAKLAKLREGPAIPLKEWETLAP